MQYEIKTSPTKPARIAEPQPTKPARFMVEVFMTDPDTGRAFMSQTRACHTLEEAQATLENVRDLLDQMSEYLGGLGVMGYEKLDEEEEVVSLTASGMAALAAAVPAGRRNTEWWAKAIKPA